MPVVKTREGKMDTERVIKHGWGIVCIDGTQKVSIPWRRVESIREIIPADDAPDTQTYADVRDDAEVIR